jgi:uncharacterized protein
MTLPPRWFLQAHDLISELAAAGKSRVSHFMQSNMLNYSEKWNPVLAEMFGNSGGSSMDFPNLHRKLKGRGGPQEYERIWTRNIRKAGEAGIHVGTISIVNESTFELGAERFYSHFVEELGIRDFQINTPFPGGSANEVKNRFPLEVERLTGFLLDLAEVWLKRGFQDGVRVGPFDRLMSYFVHGDRNPLCIWREDCSNEFVCIDPDGNVAQCDCWVSSYPKFRYGNMFESPSLSDLLEASSSRRLFQDRPGVLMRHEDCLECNYLHLCHGGCPVRAYTFHGDLFRKDPYCELYKELFRAVEAMALDHFREQSTFPP